jgi:hypothetical protein
MALSPVELERLADNLLSKEFKDTRKNKVKTTEYPILSPSQYKRRQLTEIPYSNLSTRQKLNARQKNYEYVEEEADY